MCAARHSKVYGGASRMHAVGGSVGYGSGTLPSGSKSTDNFIYYDATITNTSATEPKDAKFISTGSELVLSNPSEYAASIIRFTVPTDNIPLADNLSYFGTGDFKTGSFVITNVRPSVIHEFNVNSNINIGWLAFLPNYIAFSSTVVSVLDNGDGSVNITLNRALIGTSTDLSFSLGGYVVTMRSTGGLVNQLPVVFSLNTQTYQEYIADINYTLSSCFAELKARDSDITTIDAPFIVLDTNTQKLTMYAQKDYWWTNNDQSNPNNCVGLYVNRALYKLLNGIPSIPIVDPVNAFALPFFDYRLELGDSLSNWHGISSALTTYPTVTPTGEIIQVITTSSSTTITLVDGPTIAYTFWVGQSITGEGIPSSTTIATIIDRGSFTISNAATASSLSANARWFSAPYTAYDVSQASSSLPLWTPIQRIVFTTSMPVSSQTIQNIAIEPGIVTNINTNQYRPVLIDFEPIYGIDDYTPYQYYPQGPWRFNDLIGSTDLRTVDIQVYWIDNRGNYNLVSIPPNDKCSIQLAFIKKQFITY